MNKYNLRILIFSFLLLNIVTGMAQENLQISLEEAISLAKKENVEIRIADYNTDASNFSLKEAKGNSLPKLNLSGSYYRNIDKQSSLTSDNELSSSLNLSLPIFSKYNSSNKKYAQTNIEFQMESARGTIQNVVANTKTAYLTYLIVLETVKVQQKSLENAQENLNIVQNKLNQGKVTEYDLMTAKVHVNSAKNNLLSAKNNIVPAENNIKLLLNLPNTTSLELTDPVDISEANEAIPQYNENVLKQNSDYKQQELNVSLVEDQIEITKSSYYPSLDFIGNYSYSAQANNFDFADYNWVNTSLVGVQLEVSIFNGNINKNKVERNKISKNIAEEQKDYVWENNLMQLKELHSELEYSLESVLVQKEKIDLAAEALKLAKERYQYGKGTFIEVNDAELDYTNSRMGWLEAILDYKLAFFNYELLIGIE